jgi:hypothetical protein
MGVKYYTHFVLSGETDDGEEQEFSGVVEVNKPTEIGYEAHDIEDLLARNFNIKTGDVKLLNWSRLQ